MRFSVPHSLIASKLNGSNAAMAPQLGHPSTGILALNTSSKQVKHTNKSGSPCAHSTGQKDWDSVITSNPSSELKHEYQYYLCKCTPNHAVRSMRNCVE